MFKFLEERKLLNQLELVTFINVSFQCQMFSEMSKKDFKAFKKELKIINKYMKPYMIHKTLFPCLFMYGEVDRNDFLDKPLKEEDFREYCKRSTTYTNYYRLVTLIGKSEYFESINDRLNVIKCQSYTDYPSGLFSEGVFQYLSKRSDWADPFYRTIFPESSCHTCSDVGSFYIEEATRDNIDLRCGSCSEHANYLLDKKERKQLMKDFINYSLKVK